jgi:hypothetical protein
VGPWVPVGLSAVARFECVLVCQSRGPRACQWPPSRGRLQPQAARMSSRGDGTGSCRETLWEVTSTALRSPHEFAASPPFAGSRRLSSVAEVQGCRTGRVRRRRRIRVRVTVVAKPPRLLSSSNGAFLIVLGAPLPIPQVLAFPAVRADVAT